MYRKIIRSLIYILLISSNLIFAGEIRDTTISLLKENYGKQISIRTYKINLNTQFKNDAEYFAKQRFFSNFIYYYELFEDNKIVGYAILDNVKGKVKPITFLVTFEVDRSVRKVDIIKYREQYGGAISNIDWLKQFAGKNSNSALELNKDIDGITGATISVKAITKGVKRLSYFITKLEDHDKDLLVSID